MTLWAIPQAILFCLRFQGAKGVTGRVTVSTGEWSVPTLRFLLLIKSTITLGPKKQQHWSQLELAPPPSTVAGSKDGAYLILRILSLLLLWWAEVENEQQKEIKIVFFYEQMATFCVCECLHIKKENLFKCNMYPWAQGELTTSINVTQQEATHQIWQSNTVFT